MTMAVDTLEAVDLTEEVQKAKQTIVELLSFIEMTEAFTTDEQTQARIQSFMREKGYWPKR